MAALGRLLLAYVISQRIDLLGHIYPQRAKGNLEGMVRIRENFPQSLSSGFAVLRKAY
jgi:hypothetical protein